MVVTVVDQMDRTRRSQITGVKSVLVERLVERMYLV